MQAELKMSYDKFEKSGSFFRLNMMPLTDIHLHSNQTGELGINGTRQYVYIFSAIAIFILLIACVNFMNPFNGALLKPGPRSRGQESTWIAA